MKIREIIWPEDRIEHIAAHQVQPKEVEEVCFGKSLVQRAKAEAKVRFIIFWGKQKPGVIYIVL